MASNKKNPNIIAQSIPQKSQDTVTKNVIKAYSAAPVKSAAEQKQKDQTIKKMTDSLGKSPAQSPSQAAAQKAYATAPRAEKQVEVAPVSADPAHATRARADRVHGGSNRILDAQSKRQRLIDTSPLSDAAKTSLSLTGSARNTNSVQGVQNAAQTAVEDVRNSSEYRRIFDEYQTKINLAGSEGERQAIANEGNNRLNALYQTAQNNAQAQATSAFYGIQARDTLNNAFKNGAFSTGAVASSEQAQKVQQEKAARLVGADRTLLQKAAMSNNPTNLPAALAYYGIKGYSSKKTGGKSDAIFDKLENLAQREPVVFNSAALGSVESALAGAGMVAANTLAEQSKNPLKQAAAAAASDYLAKNGVFGNSQDKIMNAANMVYQAPTSKVGKLAEQAVAGAGGMAPWIALGGAGSALGAAGELAGNASGVAKVMGAVGQSEWSTLGPMALSSMQQSTGEALKDGATREQAYFYGTASGLLSVITEKIAGGIPGLPEGVITDLITSRINQPVIKTAVRLAVDTVGEGFEEVLESVASPFLKRITYDPNADWNAEEIADSFLTGVLTSILLQGATGGPLQSLNQAQQEQLLQGIDTLQEEQRSRKLGDAVEDAVLSVNPDLDTQQGVLGYEERQHERLGNAIEQGLDRTAEMQQESQTDGKPFYSIAYDSLMEKAENGTLSLKEAQEALHSKGITQDEFTLLLDSISQNDRVRRVSDVGTERASANLRQLEPTGRYQNDMEEGAYEILQPSSYREIRDEIPDFSEPDSLVSRLRSMSEAEIMQAVQDGELDYDVVADYLERSKRFAPHQQSRMEQLEDMTPPPTEDDIISGLEQQARDEGRGTAYDQITQRTEQRVRESERLENENPQLSHAENAANLVERWRRDVVTAYEDPELRQRSVLETSSRQDLTDISIAINALGRRSAQEGSPIARARELHDLDIDLTFDPQFIKETPNELLTIADFEYEMKTRAKDIVDFHSLTLQDQALAKQAAKQGSLSWIWSRYNRQQPDNLNGVVELFEVEYARRVGSTQRTKYNRARQNYLTQVANEMTPGIEHAKDRIGFRFSISTPLRALRAILPNNNQMVSNLYDTYFAPLYSAEAERTKRLRGYYEELNTVRLNRNEAAYTQMLLDNNQEVMVRYLEKYSDKIDTTKCQRKADIYKRIFDEVYDVANRSLVRNGYDALGKFEHYSPHFEERLGKFRTALKRMGFRVSDVTHLADEFTDIEDLPRQQVLPDGTIVDLSTSDELPNTIAGRTEEFRPDRKWSANVKTRTGENTDYNIDIAFQQYIEPMLDIVYYTDGIDYLRSLEDTIRYTTANVNVRYEVDNLLSDPDLDTLTRRQKIDQLYNTASGFGQNTDSVHLKNMEGNNLSGFITWLRRYTDNIAGKKSVDDRAMEFYMTRSAYRVTNNVFSRISRNMVTSFSSACTNFIPIVGAFNEAGPINTVLAAYDMATSMFHPDLFAEASEFLTIRSGSGTMNPGLLDNALELFNIPDQIASNLVARAYYREGLSNGLTHNEALDYSSQRSGELMADRAKTQLPIFMQQSNPIMKLLTQFQVEVNNDLQHLLSDLPARVRNGEDSGYRVLFSVFGAAVGYHVFNGLFEKAFGYRPYGLDFVEWIKEFLDIDDDDDDEFEDEEEDYSVYDNLKELGGNVGSALPFIGSLLGGGRIPMTAALPYGSFTKAMDSLKNLSDDEVGTEEKVLELLKQWSKPIATLAFPAFGNQIRKSVIGAYAMENGGIYGFDKDGNKRLYAALDSDSWGKWIHALIGGESSLPEVQKYYDDSNKGKYNKLTAEQTKIFDDIRAGNSIYGVDADGFADYCKAWNQLKNDTDSQGKEIYGTRAYKFRMMLASDDTLTSEQKRLLDERIIGETNKFSTWFGTQEIKHENPVHGFYDASPEEIATANYYLSTGGNMDKAVAALHAGFNWNDVAEISDALDGIDSTLVENPYLPYDGFSSEKPAYLVSSSVNKALALFDLDGYDEDQKRAAAGIFISDSASEWDFSDEHRLVLSSTAYGESRDALMARYDTLDTDTVSQEDLIDAALNLSSDAYMYHKTYDNYGEASDKKGYMRYALASMDFFDNAEKKEIGRVLFDDPENLSYSDKGSISCFARSESCGNKYAAAKYYGLSSEDFIAGWNVFWKAKDRKGALRDIGFSSSQIEAFTKIAYLSKENAAHYTLDDEGSAAFDGVYKGNYHRYYGRRRGRRGGRRGGRRSGGGGGGSVSAGSSSGSGRKTHWDNPALNGYSADTYTAAYNAADVGKDQRTKIENVIKATGWSWYQASSFVDVM